MRVNVVFFSGIIGCEHTGHLDGNLPNRKLVTRLESATACHGFANDCCVLVLLKLIPTTKQQLKISSRPQFRRRHAIEHDDIEAGAAIVGEYLNRYYFPN